MLQQEYFYKAVRGKIKLSYRINQPGKKKDFQVPMTLLGEIIRVRYRKSIGVNAFVVFL